MATTTNVSNLKINVLTKEQYDAATKDENQLYLITNSSSTSIPNFSATNNGQFLGIVNGALTWVTLNTEEWTFTLEDDSTITKRVVVME